MAEWSANFYGGNYVIGQWPYIVDTKIFDLPRLSEACVVSLRANGGEAGRVTIDPEGRLHLDGMVTEPVPLNQRVRITFGPDELRWEAVPHG